MRAILIFLLAAFATSAFAGDNATPPELSGQTFIHDPSTVIRDGTNDYVFGTGPGIRIKTSPDLFQWDNAGSVFRHPPKWTRKVAPDFWSRFLAPDDFWAPDIIRVNGKFFLYYSVSAFGKQTSAIGLATSPTLDQTATNYLWTDAGEVLRSGPQSPFNAIDPSVLLDTDGKLWLAFGSFWQGIFLTELNPLTGKRTGTNAPFFHLAWNHSIEAACLTRHGNFYYLFVNWGECCQGTNSTYEVRVGRAAKITGPYLDRAGKNLADGGGSPFLQSHGRFIGPGHIGIVADGSPNGPTRFSYHYYDAATQGRSRLAIGTIGWTDGWPVAR